MKTIPLAKKAIQDLIEIRKNKICIAIDDTYLAIFELKMNKMLRIINIS